MLDSCLSPLDTNPTKSGGWPLWVIIVVAVSSAIGICGLGITGFYLRRQFFRRFTRDVKRDRAQFNVSYHPEQREPSPVPSVSEEHIYEEIGPPTGFFDYDRLQFENTPLPLSATKDHYDKPKLPEKRPPN